MGEFLSSFRFFLLGFMKDDVKKLTNEVSITFKDILEYKIFTLGKYSLTVYEIAAALIFILLGYFAVLLVKKLIYRSEKLDLGKKFAFTQILKYIILIITFFIVMRTIGVNISPLLVGSGAILVGIGLGLQNLFLDFISGIIILLDRTVRVGDVVDVDGTVGQVQEIQMRTTTVLTRDNKNIIFPISMLTKDRLINFSHNDSNAVFDIEVGVHYDTDIDFAEKLMMEAALQHDDVMKEPAPVVRLEEFADSALVLKMFYTSENLFRSPRVKSDIRKGILKKFRENQINIPYPIRTLEIPMNFSENEENKNASPKQ